MSDILKKFALRARVGIADHDGLERRADDPGQREGVELLVGAHEARPRVVGPRVEQRGQARPLPHDAARRAARGAARARAAHLPQGAASHRVDRLDRGPPLHLRLVGLRSDADQRATSRGRNVSIPHARTRTFTRQLATGNWNCATVLCGTRRRQAQVRR